MIRQITANRREKNLEPFTVTAHIWSLPDLPKIRPDKRSKTKATNVRFFSLRFNLTFQSFENVVMWYNNGMAYLKKEDNICLETLLSFVCFMTPPLMLRKIVRPLRSMMLDEMAFSHWFDLKCGFSKRNLHNRVACSQHNCHT